MHVAASVFTGKVIDHRVFLKRAFWHVAILAGGKRPLEAT